MLPCQLPAASRRSKLLAGNVCCLRVPPLRCLPRCQKATSLSLLALALLSLRRRAAAAAAAAAALAPRRACSPAITGVATLLRCRLRSCSHAILHIHALLVPLMPPQAMKRSCNTDSWYFCCSFSSSFICPHPVAPSRAAECAARCARRSAGAGTAFAACLVCLSAAAWASLRPPPPSRSWLPLPPYEPQHKREEGVK